MKQLKIHALPTEDVQSEPDGKTFIKYLSLYKSESPNMKETFDIQQAWAGMNTINMHHIYLTDDSPIQDGDWFLNIAIGKIGKATFDFESSNNARKIIATTDRELNKILFDDEDKLSLPNISQQDLPKIADALNKGVTSVGQPMSMPFIDNGCIVLDWGDVIEKYMSDEFNERRNNRYTVGIDPIFEHDDTKCVDWGEEVVSNHEIKLVGFGHLFEFMKEQGCYSTDGHTEHAWYPFKLKYDGALGIGEKMYTKEEVEKLITSVVGHMVQHYSWITSGFDLEKWIKDNLK
jgi:hypothetical protein